LRNTASEEAFTLEGFLQLPTLLWSALSESALERLGDGARFGLDQMRLCPTAQVGKCAPQEFRPSFIIELLIASGSDDRANLVLRDWPHARDNRAFNGLFAQARFQLEGSQPEAVQLALKRRLGADGQASELSQPRLLAPDGSTAQAKY